MSLFEIDPPEETPPEAPRRSRRWLYATLVALAALAVVVALVLVRQAPAPEPERTALPETPARQPKPAPVRESPSPEVSLPRPAPRPAASPTTGTLRIDSDVPEASIFVDRVYVGTAPVTAGNLTPGLHQVNASAPGFDGWEEAIEVAPGERDVIVRFKEVRLDVAIDVVHKHAIGSCSGRLTASPQGLRYQASNPNDSFQATMQQLEVFEVEYLKKNLRIKLRGGRTYNFTDPHGDADRLFVFHRDVQKAREKLR